MVSGNIEKIVNKSIEKLAVRENNGEILEFKSNGKIFNIHLKIERNRVWALSSLDRTKMKGKDIVNYLHKVNAIL